MALVSPYLSIITLNANGSDSLIKKHRVVEWIKKKKKTEDSIIFSLHETHFSFKNTQKPNVKG